jgi:hypothetical protein
VIRIDFMAKLTGSAPFGEAERRRLLNPAAGLKTGCKSTDPNHVSLNPRSELHPEGPVLFALRRRIGPWNEKVRNTRGKQAMGLLIFKPN